MVAQVSFVFSSSRSLSLLPPCALNVFNLQVVNQERETQKLKAKKKEMHLRHKDLSERLKVARKFLHCLA